MRQSLLGHIATGFLGVLVTLAQPVDARAAWECPEVAATAESCGQAVCPEDGIQTEDALKALKAAVGTAYCAACRCDTDDSGAVTASDASRILRAAIGPPVNFRCGQCNSLSLHLVENPNAVSADAEIAVSCFTQFPWQYTRLGIAVLSDGRVACLIRYTMFPMKTRLAVNDGEGNLLSETVVLDGVYALPGLDCKAGSDRCVTSWHSFGQESLAATVINADSPNVTDTVVIKLEERDGQNLTEITTGPVGSKLACDPSGVCVAAWLLLRTTTVDQDAFEDYEALAIFAAAFNARTGELGSELLIDSADPDDYRGPSIIGLGENRFAVTTYRGAGETTRFVEVR